MNALVNTLEKTTNKETTLSLPIQLKAALPLSAKLAQQISQHRQTVQNILNGTDKRLMVITGPCSIHDPVAVLEYAEKLIELQAQVSDQIFLVMRAYIEKPRTTVGWKGFLYDPNLDGSANMQLGLEKSRQLYLQLIEMGLPLASEILSPMATAYFDDLLAWGAIGARTSESQIHREISSHMPFSIGFKNGTDGSIQIALDAIQSASNSHQFLGLSQSGLPSIIESEGNPHAHLILRGSNTGANFSIAEIDKIKQKVKGELPALVIDCSHGNSAKDPLNQPDVLKTIVAERLKTNVRGVMLESHLVDGNQKISCDMTYGQSVTDGCLGWEKTEQLLNDIASTLRCSEIKLSA
ncbi:3-deoxy-7-phosphoheptulonate synthase [Acinetobacter portensis]|uniref:Phospho-2-dehydro-3-deoxyheptonate aldolase n=2 Tax=Acinetobacter TaxID=469 RepID=A0A6L6GBF5_9GAMM|nr:MULTISPECIES: 3-deoxy-7-phosphoheptulonate synthase [Acinetobacter]MCK7607830.1 3-deoxy-7-phosphoheptulonate synthase [Acinetobacter portensis]MCK7638656.1 3-deoxy-7-phosphoheptulonate synthase [Acinetobacter portensis]MDY6458469.1 3-deoxy-7-phosphoheptulonate synthase [Acinetobacter faecalis]MDY6460599.1 3-deoxy-7-phosphoheptulonate synthase [Acinetobacter faecalis]MDY6483894.1 3-deoxy-7-phosphoheptulonate synthase [Acinetobacter faecalis]